MKMRVVTIAVAFVFVISGAVLLWYFAQYRQGATDYLEAEKLAFSSSVPSSEAGEGAVHPSVDAPESEQAATASVRPEPTPADADGALGNERGEEGRTSIDLTALQAVNDDVIGWIEIPDTNISYPLVIGVDNDYYLNHTWSKSGSAVGSIFADYRNSRTLDGFNTIIYGHRTGTGSMFGHLHLYKDEGFWKSHPRVYITSAERLQAYEVFSAYEASVTSGSTYQIDFSDDHDKQAFIDYCLSQSVIDTGVIPDVNDRIITLSTCTGNGHATRWVIQAVLRATT